MGEAGKVRVRTMLDLGAEKFTPVGESRTSESKDGCDEVERTALSGMSSTVVEVALDISNEKESNLRLRLERQFYQQATKKKGRETNGFGSWPLGPGFCISFQPNPDVVDGGKPLNRRGPNFFRRTTEPSAETPHQ